MKKLITVFSLLLITISMSLSCSSDDGGSENVGDIVLIKKTTETFYSDNEIVGTITSDFIYENNNLTTFLQGNYRSEISYNGDKITQISNFFNDIPNAVSTYNYNGNLLESIVLADDEEETITKYYYTNERLNKTEDGFIDENNQFIVEEMHEFIFDSSSNITETTNTYYDFDGTPHSSKTKYSYDNKNSAVKFMNKYLKQNFYISGIRGINQNNYITEELYTPTNTTTPSIQTLEIVYNENNFPTQIKKLNQSDELISITTIQYQ